MTRHGFSLRKKMTTTQKEPSFLVDRIVSYAIYVRRLQKYFFCLPSNIIAMDETPLSNDMKKFGAKEIPLKSKRNEEVCFSMRHW